MSCSSAASGDEGRLWARRCSRWPLGVVAAVLDPPPPHAASAATGPAAATATPDRTSRRRVTPDVISSSLLGADETDPMRAGAAQRPGALKGRPGALPDYAGVSLARLVRSRPSRW